MVNLLNSRAMSNLFLIAFSHNPVNFSKSLVTDRPLSLSPSLCLSRERERQGRGSSAETRRARTVVRGKRGGGGERGQRSLVKEALQQRPEAIHHPNNCFPSHHLIPMERHSPPSRRATTFYTEYYRENISYSTAARAPEFSILRRATQSGNISNS